MVINGLISQLSEIPIIQDKYYSRIPNEIVSYVLNPKSLNPFPHVTS
jgi:hypothetical protein